jgi:hypothetical protein
VDDGGSFTAALGRMFSDYNRVAAKYPFEILEGINNLFLLDPNFGQYESTTLALGNPGHDLEIDAPNEKRAQEAIQAANDLAARCYPYAGGLDGLITGMLSQVARYGALCPEWAPDEKLTQIQRAYLFPISTVRFRRTPAGELELGQLQDGKFVPLNPVQTTYHAVFHRDGDPYGIPPAMTALQSAVDHKKIHGSLRDWFGKLAVLGFLSLQWQRPDLKPGESEDEYRTRCVGILQDLAKNVQANLKSGIVAGFDDLDATFQNTTAGAAGAKQIAELIDHDLFAGFGRPPSMFGRNFSTTDTWATVAFEQVQAELRHMQLGVKRAVETGHRLNLALCGLGDVGVSVTFREPRTLNVFMDNEAEQMKSTSIISQYEAGIIDRAEARKLLGHDDRKAKSDAFIASFNSRADCYERQPVSQTIWSGTDLSVPDVLDNSARDARRAAREYLFQIQQELSDAAQTGVDAVLAWARARDIPEEEVFVAEALRTFNAGVEKHIDSAALERIAKTHLETIWMFGRHEDLTVFGPDWDRTPRGFGVEIGSADRTAIDYLSRVDRFYASKFASDDRTQKRIRDFLREQYLDRGLGRGKSTKELNKFIELFGDHVEGLTEHRARVIIDTGVSRAQNWGSILALHDEGFVEFRIAGPWDRLTCGWCDALRNHRFRVEIEADRINEIIDSGEEDISQFHEFITSRFGGKAGLEELEGLSAEEVQASGMVTAPVHPQCRHRTVAVRQVNRNSIDDVEAPSLVDWLMRLRAA